MSDEVVNMDVEDEAQGILDGMAPIKSAKRYEKAYEDYLKWKTDKYPSYPETAPLITENLLLVYFNFLLKEKKLLANSLQSKLSMLKSEFGRKQRLDLDKFKQVQSLINKHRAGYQPTQAKTFTQEEIYEFLNKADNFHYLSHKVLFKFKVNV